MGKFKRIFCVNLTVLFAFPLCFVFAANEFPIGAIFDSKSNNVKLAFVQEINRINIKSNKRIQLKPVIQELDATDSFAVSNAICALLRKGVYGIIGVSNASALSTIQSYSNTFQVPFIVLGMAQNTTNHGPFQLFMRPLYTDGLLAVITEYGWERILYIYDTDEGLLRLQQLFQVVNMKETTLDIDVKRVANPQKCYEELKKKQKKHEKELFRVLLDMSTENAEEVILKIKNDTEVHNHMFHFLLGELRIEEMNEANFAKGGMNITGFQLLNYTHLQNSNDNERLKWDWPDNFMSLEAALVIDALGMLLRALNQLENQRGRQPAQYPLHVNFRQSVKCTDSNYVSPLKGTNLTEILKGIEYDGLTGKVTVDEHGFRDIFTLNLEEITMIRGLSHVGSWNPDKGLKVHDPIFWPPKPGNASRKRNITTILEKPYLMYKDPKHEEDRENAPKCGKEYFEGFCAELAQKVAGIVGYDYELCLVKDGEYGQKLEDGTWSGVIGELTREEVDLAVAPITITSTRERVVDFTKPYMSLGISIMIKKTSVKKASVFSFMDPLSYEIWMCILFAYIGVSVVLFLVSRFSPTEWHIEDGSNITNDFTISNSLWYSLGAFMQQGCDISPRSVSGRIVGSVWWFFTLIIISSYTANLAAFLTVERMLTPIESAEDLAKQTEIQYGTLQAGSTKDFFQYSKFPVYERMWAYMQSASPSVLVKNTEEGIERVRKGNYAYLIESTTNDYNNMRMPCDTMRVGPNLDSKGYGIATPIGSDLRDKLTLAVLKLRESGDLKYMQKKWWDERSECPAPSSSQDGGQTELTLSNVAGIFYILVAGLLLSVIIACLEFLYKSKLDSKRSKKSFGSVLRCKARLSFRGSLDRDTPASSTPLRKSMSTYTYTGPTQMVGNDGFPDNTHTQV